jgi:hypothetical protein
VVGLGGFMGVGETAPRYERTVSAGERTAPSAGPGTYPSGTTRTK